MRLGNTSQATTRPMLYARLSLDSPKAVADHARPAATSAKPNRAVSGTRSA